MRRLVSILVLALLLAGCGHSLLATTSTSIGGAGTDPTYRGPQVTHQGPVQTDPKVVLVYWGSVWKTGAFQQQVRGAEKAMFAKIPGSAWAGVLTQYGVHDDAQLLGSIILTNPVPNRAIGYKVMQTEVAQAVQRTGFHPTQDVQWVLFPPPSANLANFNDECGEHDDFKANGQTYVYSLVMPFDTKQFGTGQASCVQYDAWGANKVEATTSLTSHEFAESATDPLSGTNGNGTGWWSDKAAKRFGMGAAEIDDFCYGQAIQPWGTQGPTVQATWSNKNEGPQDNRGCVASLAGGAPRMVGQTQGVAARPLPASSSQARARLIGGR